MAPRGIHPSGAVELDVCLDIRGHCSFTPNASLYSFNRIYHDLSILLRFWLFIIANGAGVVVRVPVQGLFMQMTASPGTAAVKKNDWVSGAGLCQILSNCSLKHSHKLLLLKVQTFINIKCLISGNGVLVGIIMCDFLIIVEVKQFFRWLLATWVFPDAKAHWHYFLF